MGLLRTHQSGGGPVIFLHVPKTAGTTLGHIIERQYPRGTVHEIEPETQQAQIAAFKALPHAARAHIRLLRGHIGYGLHEFLDGDATYITMLRHPVDRVLSHYYYVRAEIERGTAAPGDHVTFDDVARMSLVDYVRHASSADIRNGQTRLIAGGMTGWDAERDEVDTSVLDVALRTLERDVRVIGLTERFDESVLLFKQALGWSTPFYVRANVTVGKPGRAQLAPEVVAAIEDANALDMRLYARAQELFQRAVDERGPAFQRELAQFKFLNNRYADLHRLRDAARYRFKRLRRSYLDARSRTRIRADRGSP